MKIICCDNYARESVSDKLIKEGLGEDEARKMADDLNKQEKGSDNWYRAVPDTQKLHVYDPT